MTRSSPKKKSKSLSLPSGVEVHQPAILEHESIASGFSRNLLPLFAKMLHGVAEAGLGEQSHPLDESSSNDFFDDSSRAFIHDDLLLATMDIWVSFN